MKGSQYFKNTKCEFFPCHKTDGDFFNCMFCYCPLYALGENCGGSFTYTETGIKDCSRCLRPHKRENYESICKCLDKILELAKKKDTP